MKDRDTSSDNISSPSTATYKIKFTIYCTTVAVWNSAHTLTKCNLHYLINSMSVHTAVSYWQPDCTHFCCEQVLQPLYTDVSLSVCIKSFTWPDRTDVACCSNFPNDFKLEECRATVNNTLAKIKSNLWHCNKAQLCLLNANVIMLTCPQWQCC